MLAILAAFAAPGCCARSFASASRQLRALTAAPAARGGVGSPEQVGADALGEQLMLNIYPVSIQLCRDVRTITQHLRDKNLIDQMRRAASSVPLNLAESDGVTGGNRRQRLLTALGSARELGACFDVAEALCGATVDSA